MVIFKVYNWYIVLYGVWWLRIRVLVWREEDMFVAREVVTGITSQGRSVEEALENLREALELYLEEVPEALEKLEVLDRNLVGVLEFEAKASKAIGA